jgi:hypothetical protein
MTDYTWTIATCEHDIATGGITVAHWRCSAVDGDFTASAYGTCGFTPDATSPDFKPYDEVTEAEVLGWVWGLLIRTRPRPALPARLKHRKTL